MTNLTISRAEPFLHEWVIDDDYDVATNGPLDMELPVRITQNGLDVVEGTTAQGTALLYRDGKIILSFAVHDTSLFDVGVYEYRIAGIINDEEQFSDSGTITVVDEPQGQPDVRVRPWDLFNPNVPRADEETRDERLAICGECPFLHLGVCSKCGCVMRLKTTLRDATCPVGKW